MYFGRFSLEGGFIGLYLLAVALACLSARRACELGLVEAMLWGLLLGAVTTIKITLWPVTLMIVGAFVCMRPGSFQMRQLFVWSGMLIVTLLTYFIVGAMFADDPGEQMDWFLRLIAESGRYGCPSEEGSFLPFADIYHYTVQGLSLQSYTTLFPLVALSAFAIFECIKQKRIELRLLSIGFLACLLLSFLIYTKHPY